MQTKKQWNSLKSPVMPKKTVVSSFNTMNNNRSLPNDIKNVSKVFKDFFSKYVESFLAKLPDPSNKYNLESVFLYYLNLAILEVFHIKSTSEEKVFKIQKKNRDFQSRRYRQTLWKIV